MNEHQTLRHIIVHTTHSHGRRCTRCPAPRDLLPATTDCAQSQKGQNGPRAHHSEDNHDAWLPFGPDHACRRIGLIEDAPAPLIKANGGMGADKALWGAEFLGTTRANVLILLGVCKAATLLDIWVLHIVPQLACLCYAVMMGLVFHCHQAMGDDLPPPVVIGTMALITMVTWPAAKKANGKKRTQ